MCWSNQRTSKPTQISNYIHVDLGRTVGQHQLFNYMSVLLTSKLACVMLLTRTSNRQKLRHYQQVINLIIHGNIFTRYRCSSSAIQPLIILVSVAVTILIEFSFCIIDQECEENTNKGVEFMAQAAGANDRASILYMAKAFETGIGLGTSRYWMQRAMRNIEMTSY